MGSLRRAAATIVAATAALAVLATAEAPRAQANPACDLAGGTTAPVSGAVGLGNPIGDACEKVTGAAAKVIPDPTAPLKGAVESIKDGVFEEITAWAADGAVWLLGRVAALTNRSTTPNLLGKGFLSQYREMARIAVVLALLMVLFAVLESLGRGDASMLARVFFVQIPVAAIATSAAYVLVQLLIATTDGFSEAVARGTADDVREFFKSAMDALREAGASAGAASGVPSGAAQGEVAVPLLVGFIAAMLAACASFLVWIELLMRDAAIYAVALFMPMAIAASIWPRWQTAMKRTAELLIVIVASKFVIVAIISLAASLLASTGGKVEPILAAGALMLLACFSPVVLLRLVPFAEGAVGAAYGRQSAGGAVMRSVQMSSSASMMRAAKSNWGGGAVSAAQQAAKTGQSSKGNRGGGAQGRNTSGAQKPSAGKSSTPTAQGATATAQGAGAGMAVGAAGAAAKAGTDRARNPAAGGPPAARERREGGEAAGSDRPPRPQSPGSGAESPQGEAHSSTSQGGGSQDPPRPSPDEKRRDRQSEKEGPRPRAGEDPAPSQADGGDAPQAKAKPPRPPGESARPKGEGEGQR